MSFKKNTTGDVGIMACECSGSGSGGCAGGCSNPNSANAQNLKKARAGQGKLS